MKKHFLTILIILFFTVGSSVLLYPSVSDYINTKHASKAISSYNDTMENTSDNVLEEIIAEAEAYNTRLKDDPSAFFIPERINGYLSALDLTGTGIMGYIDIDRINVELPLYHGVSQEVLQVGVGHLEGTSLPVGGKSTHCVLSGHRGLPSAKLFTDLDELEIGDEFTITVMKKRMTYRVDQIKTVLPTDTDDLQIIKGMDYCTLLTCTPYGINSHRLLVRGVRIADREEKTGIFIRNEAFRISPLIVAPIAAIPLLIATLIFIFIHDKHSVKKNNKNLP